MKKRISLILLTLVLVFGLALSVSAEAPLVTDLSGLLSDREITSLEAEYQEIKAQYGFTPYLLTVDSFDGMSGESYATYAYDSMGCDYDGILLLVSLEEGYWSIHVKGICDQTLTNDDIDTIGEKAVDYLRDGEYYKAFRTFGRESVKRMEKSAKELEAEKAFLKPNHILFGFVAGLVIALIVVLIMNSGMKTVKRNNTANYYVRSGSMNVTYSRDIFLYSTVSKVRKSSDSSSGGSRGGGGGRSRGGRI